MSAAKDFYALLYLRFFLLAFTISTIIWATIPLINSTNYFLTLWLTVTGVYGPSIAGVMLSYRYHGTYWQHYIPKWYYFLPIFVVCSGLGISYMIALMNFFSPYRGLLTVPVILLILLDSALTAYLLSLMLHPPPGFETRNEHIFQMKSQLNYFGFAILLPLLIAILSFSLQEVLAPSTVQHSFSEEFTGIATFPLYITTFSLLFSGPVNEELGWRGYLTPKALEQFNPLTIGLIIGFLWSLWHVPLYIIGIYGGGWIAILYRFAWNIPMGILFTWYYIKSGYNLLGAILLHASFNLFSYIGAYYIIPAYIIVALVVIVEGKMWVMNYGKPYHPHL